MTWYKKAKFNKKASVSFYIEDAQKIAEPMDIFKIAMDLEEFMQTQLLQEGESIGSRLGIPWSVVQVGSLAPHYTDEDIHKGDIFIGPLEFWLPDTNITEEMVRYIINQYNEYRYGTVVLSLDNIETQKDGQRIAHISIVENDTQDYTRVPSMNVSQDNAIALLQMLRNEGVNVSDDMAGYLDIDELSQAIQQIENNEYMIETYTRPTYEQTEDDKPRYTDFGVAQDQIMGYLQGLKQMINYIRDNDLPNNKIGYA